MCKPFEFIGRHSTVYIHDLFERFLNRFVQFWEAHFAVDWLPTPLFELSVYRRNGWSMDPCLKPFIEQWLIIDRSEPCLRIVEQLLKFEVRDEIAMLAGKCDYEISRTPRRNFCHFSHPPTNSIECLSIDLA